MSDYCQPILEGGGVHVLQTFLLYSLSGHSSSCILVYLKSLEDGRESIVATARTICKRVSEKDMSPVDITTQSLDSIIQGQ